MAPSCCIVSQHYMANPKRPKRETHHSGGWLSFKSSQKKKMTHHVVNEPFEDPPDGAAAAPNKQT
eukprot:scaffold111254_cov39-Attheya_sp.AAC.1